MTRGVSRTAQRLQSAVLTVVVHARGARAGQAYVEYGLITTLIALTLIAVLLLIGPIIETFFSNTGQTLQ